MIVGMLTAMPTAALPPSPQANPATRARGDACPGALRLHTADDGALARVRLPGGVLTLGQAAALGRVARRLGDGDLHLTSRGNVQLRGLAAGCGGELAEALDTADLLPSREHERVRNIVASPLSGLDGEGVQDVRPWLTALDAALCASDAARNLSGRFLFALDDGRGDVTGLGADVTVRATGDGLAWLTPGSVRVAADDAPLAALVAAETFLQAARSHTARTWRVSELPLPEGELDRLIRDRLTAAGIAHDEGPEPVGSADGPPPGVVGEALSAHVPLGRLSALQWEALTRVADTELRLTPWRGVVVPNVGATAAQVSESLERLRATGLVTDPASPWLRVGACIGRPGCAKAHADVRADAARTLEATGRPALPLYWSGCARRCGHPSGEHVDVLATPEGGYRLSVAPADRETRTAFAADPSRMGAALAAIIS
ncbi:cobalamin biosynthesis protein CobG [Streptomyces cellostaticus]|uniref:Cobalamin biosynthesis protein CobG n=2 Tax=Streptomyces cellostaticus TaxID=67285 RepID=A0A117PYR5_9ACTN|nr:precorrin-3B synthase [Streptomyces cellostaticus]KUM98423.1 cobalamin biosynthesis protein CobG [Streptomyces cellostaticus]